MRFTKPFLLTVIAMGLISSSLAVVAQNSSRKSTVETSVVGYISDGMCGLKHMSGMGDDKNCTLACVKQGSKFVLADRDHKRVYQLDHSGQDKARAFVGQKVKVTGVIRGRSIRVTNIEPT
jgi:hypothetical protein